MPYFMALRKPYDCTVRHFLWQDIFPDMENAPYGEIAARIRWHRAVENLNQTEYAEKAGIRRSQLSNWETGQQRVSVDGAIALRRTYGLSLDFIYEGIDDTLPMTLRQALRDKPLVNASK
jgi:transcriptional regulator with XRE-family HTH domain